ncbi:MAG: bifunctional methylenetetrahydrofolate dehydrogenase/methenyltetrahydrofolate cyclohydrolase FolD [Clostridia bacterium]|nr:bifunctional methylenetetrahydrofolate dehydrogenase/methenyltetrahydrofolate cyclohydrolase FolD [Clostridia bacterium]
MAQIISGKEVSQRVRERIKLEASELFEKTGKKPGLAVIIVGEDPASQVYVRNKAKGCEEVGFHSEVYRLPEDTKMEELLALIEKLNNDCNIHGILCQLPLPKHLDETEVILAINPNKDVDAFHPVNTGKIMIGNYSFLPCTPAGVMELIASTGVDVAGKECVVVGRSNIVGKPQAMLLLQKNGTVTICHSKTKNLKETTKRADILVVAVGRANFITGDMIKDGAIVVDVGINRNEEGKLVGDVHFESAEKVASYITPVPGGVGPMTITMLLQNTLTAAKEQIK